MRSRLEEQVAALLDELGIEYGYEPEKLNYVIEAQYIPDFKVGDVYLETKGFFKPSDRRKMLAVKKSNPDKDIRLVFQAPYNKISFQWCPYYEIPLDWLQQ
jgi:predicted nuclease of restriction endonuclease-like RecB superfamily